MDSNAWPPGCGPAVSTSTEMKISEAADIGSCAKDVQRLHPYYSRAWATASRSRARALWCIMAPGRKPTPMSAVKIAAAMNGVEMNRLAPDDRAVHDWYRFILSYPPHLVREYLRRFQVDGSQRVLDPFCGTGTTLVECKKQGIPSVGIEANPMAHFACQVKVDWTPMPPAWPNTPNALPQPRWRSWAPVESPMRPCRSFVAQARTEPASYGSCRPKPRSSC